MKSGFTRTGKRTTMGVLDDGYKVGMCSVSVIVHVDCQTEAACPDVGVCGGGGAHEALACLSLCA